MKAKKKTCFAAEKMMLIYFDTAINFQVMGRDSSNVLLKYKIIFQSEHMKSSHWIVQN